jgi:hypothetical protein
VVGSLASDRKVMIAPRPARRPPIVPPPSSRTTEARKRSNEEARQDGLMRNDEAFAELARWHRDAELETILDCTV